MCGIGGRTIAEAKQNISYPEFLDWLQYRRKRGSLHIGMRIESAVAVLASLYANRNSKGIKFSPLDFMPHADEVPITLEDAMKNWS